MATKEGRTEPKIGPSDTSDTYYDNPAGVTDSDAQHTGEDAGAPGSQPPRDETAPDRVVDEREAGLGGGLDEAEEARVDPVKAPRPRKPGPP